MSWDQYHTESERLAGEAEALLVRGNSSPAADLYRRAAEMEERALDALDPAKPRTRGITAVSALSLWHKAGEGAEVRRLGRRLLAEPLPHFAQAQIRELVDAAAPNGSAPQRRFEVELTFRQTLRYAVDAGSRKLAEREAVERWKTGDEAAVVGSELCELVAVRTQPDADSERVQRDAQEVYRYLRDRELVIETLGESQFNPTVHDAVSAEEVAIHLHWRGDGRTDTARAVRALDRLCADRRVVCFTRRRERHGEKGEIRLYCTPQHLAALTSLVIDEEDIEAPTARSGTGR